MTPSLDLVFSALADPTRRAIVNRLCQRDLSVNDLVGQFQLTQPTISKHLKVLERAGLIARYQIGNQRPCRLQREALNVLEHWLRDRQGQWEQRLDAVEAILNQQSKDGSQP